MAFFFAPLIICFPAILLIKFERDLREKERYQALNLLLGTHIALLLIGIITAVEMMI